MKWRNEQIFHLRQKNKLKKEEQQYYFKNVVSKLFSKRTPKQVLFSFLHDDKLVGYGGLVHINWTNKSAEISFVMNTKLEKLNFEKYWNIFLKMISQIAFEELKFKKIFTYAYDLRPLLYNSLDNQGFSLEKEFTDDEYNKIKIHSKYNL
jgi:hypothetical protein